MINDSNFNKYSGFFLIELLIAIGIFSIFSLFIAQFHWKIIAQEKNVIQLIQALNLANSMIEETTNSSNFLGGKFKIDIFDVQIETSRIKNLPKKGNSGLQKNETLINNAKLPKSFYKGKITIIWKNIEKVNKKISLDFGWME